MRKSLVCRIAGLTMLIALVGSVSRAEAGLVTFDDATGNSLLYTQHFVGNSFSVQGLTFTNFAGSGLMYVWDGGSPNSNGTNNNIFGFTTGDTQRITLTGGGTFNLYSLDMALSWYTAQPVDTIFINGNPYFLTQGLTTLNVNLLGVTSVDITGIAIDPAYWTADNFVFTPVPVPGSLTLAGIGAVCLLGYSRLRRRVVTVA